MASPRMSPTSPELIAKLGEEIYTRKYRRDFEAVHAGKFVAINVLSEAATISATADEALLRGREADSHGLLHLIRVGFPAAFHIGYAVARSHQARLSR